MCNDVAIGIERGRKKIEKRRTIEEKDSKKKKRSYLLELKGKELETLGLETLDDLTNETALDTVGLDLLD